MEKRPINPQAGDDDAIPAQVAEESVWVGSPSQITNLGLYVACILIVPIPFALYLGLYVACILIVPIPFALYRWLQTRSHTYEVTSQRIRETTGILSKQTDDLELYRVKDMRLEQPFFLRMFHAGNIRLMTSDRTSEDFLLRAVRPKDGPRALMDQIRRYVEFRRDQKRVREIDMEPMDQT